MATTFPEAASFAGTFVPPPPAFEPKWTADQKADKLREYLNGQFAAINEMQNSIESGWLIDTVRILNLTVDNVFADQILTETLYVGSAQKIQLLGASNTIEIYDEQGTPQLRTRIGDLGTGTSNWGQEWWDSSGTLIMSVGDTVFIDGAVINDATITNAKIFDVNGTKLTNNSVAHGKISSVNASTISVGTLTADGSPVAINITGSGALVCSSGGDIILRASASGDSNVLLFQTSGGTNKVLFTYSTSLDRMTLQTQNGADMTLSMGDVGNIYVTSTTGDLDISGAAGARGDFLEITMTTCELDCTTIDLGVSTSQSVDVNADFISHLTVNADNTYDLGVLNTAWRDAYVVNGVTTGDIRFGGGQGVVLTEPDKVWSTESVSDGLVMMKGLHDWTPIYWDKADGTRQTSGFSPPDVFPIVYQPDKANELYEDIVDELTDRYLSSGKKRPTHLFRRIKDHLHQWENEQSKMHRVIRVADMNSKRQELMEKIEGGEWTNQSSRLWHKNKIQGRMIAHKESIQTKRKQRLQ